MRYIANDQGHLQAVSFGADITCAGQTCVEYTGNVPTGYKSLEAWYLAESETLYRWMIFDGNLLQDDSAAAPEDYRQVDYVVAEGVTNGWTWRKWASGLSECHGSYQVSGVDCSTAAGALFVTDLIDPAVFFPDGLFLPFEGNEDDDRMTCQMTFTSYTGTPAFVWGQSYVHPSEGASRFRLMRHTAATITGRMHYRYTGRWKEETEAEPVYFVPSGSDGLITSDGYNFTVRS